MKFEIHFETEGIEDYFVVEGETLLDVKKEAKFETDRRGLTAEKNNLWSKEVN